MIKKTLKLILVNCAILGVMIILIEVIFGGWIFSTNDLSNLGIMTDVRFEYTHDLYPSEAKTVVYSRDKFGLRGVNTFNHPEKIDVLTVGGSTTDQRYITDSLTWQQMLEKKLNSGGKSLLISNAGVDGQSSYGHIKSFELWFPKVKSLKPKYVLFYVGINDFFKLNGNSAFDDMDATSKFSLKNKIIYAFQTKSAVYNLYRKINGWISADKQRARHQKVDFSKHEYTSAGVTPPDFIKSYDDRLSGFRKRIEKLIAQTTSMGAEPIFITQPACSYQFKNDTLLGKKEVNNYMDTIPFNGVDYYQMISIINKSIKEVCSKGKHQVIELTSLPVWKHEDFYDFFHMTPAGAEKLANEIYNQIELK